MNCKKAERIILNGEQSSISLDDRRSFAAHIARCVRCNSLQSSAKQVRWELSGMASQAASRDIAGKVVNSSEWADRTSTRPWRPVLVACLSVCLILALSLRYLRKPAEQIASTGKDSQPITAPIKRGSYSPEWRPNSVGGSSINRNPIIPVPHLATAHPQQKGERTDDLKYINEEDSSGFAKWAIRSGDQREFALEATATSHPVGDDFVYVPYPQLASIASKQAADALKAYQKEREVVDDRLAVKVSISAKGASFEDLCRKLKEQSHVELSAARNVSDEKITVFCREKPLRDLMRQINAVFGFRWQRSGKDSQYSYELFQDLKSQLLEEEMRNHDRNEALIDLDRKMQGLRNLLSLTPDEAHEKAYNPEVQRSSSQEDLDKLNALSGTGWAAAHLYFNLSGDQMSSLRQGQTLQFSSNPNVGQSQLPGGVASGTMQGMRNVRAVKAIDGSMLLTSVVPGPGTGSAAGEPLSSFPSVQTMAEMRFNFDDLGEVSLWGGSGASVDGSEPRILSSMPIATGASAGKYEPDNATANAALAKEPALQIPVDLIPKPSAWQDGGFASSYSNLEKDLAEVGERKLVSTADALEAIHQATGMDIVSDYYTALFLPEKTSVSGKSLFTALNKVCDAMRVRWTRADGWLRFRRTSFFWDKLKEVPNRFLDRWVKSRRQHGWPVPTDLMEIAQLNDAQLNAGTNAVCIPACYGLREWYLGSVIYLRTHWRFLASLPPALRQEAFNEKGLDVSRVSIANQERFFALGLAKDAEQVHRVLLKAKLATTVTREYNNEPANNRPVTIMPPVDITYRFEDPTIGTWKIKTHLYVRP